jgi:hypothetical protein
MNKSIIIQFDQLLRLLTDRQSTAQAWVEDPNFRKIHTPVNCVLEMTDGWKYFEAVDPSVPFIQIHIQQAKVVKVVDHTGFSHKVSREEDYEFVELLRLAVERHDYRCHYRQGREMETLGFTVTKR